jgi:hypothetical protein
MEHEPKLEHWRESWGRSRRNQIQTHFQGQNPQSHENQNMTKEPIAVKAGDDGGRGFPSSLSELGFD